MMLISLWFSKTKQIFEVQKEDTLIEFQKWIQKNNTTLITKWAESHSNQACQETEHQPAKD
jgi:hypothetical protein